MDPARIGIVKFLNTVPLVEGLEKIPQVSLVPAPPSDLCAMLCDRAVDVALVSVIDAARASVPLAMLSCGMIGCDGPTLTVRVFSRRALADIDTLWVDTDSHTSVALATIVMHHLFDRRIAVEDFDASHGRSAERQWPDAVLLIGDKVITNAPPLSMFPHQLDLGEAWKQITGLPFVYALWMCRGQDLESDAPRTRIQLTQSLLDRQLRHNFTRLDRIIQDRAGEFNWPLDAARRYVGELLRYRVGPAEREALTRFFREASSLGILTPQQVAQVRWA